jgi:hypothetical protein
MTSSRSPWHAERDEVFFRAVQGVFPSPFLEGAGALLASYDDELAGPPRGLAGAPSAASASAPGRVPSQAAGH